MSGIIQHLIRRLVIPKTAPIIPDDKDGGIVPIAAAVGIVAEGVDDIGHPCEAALGLRGIILA